MLPNLEQPNRKLTRLLSGWALLAGLVYLILYIVFFIVAFPLTQGSPLSEDYNDLILAVRSSFISRLTIGLTLLYVLLIGGFIIILANRLYKHAPVTSALAAAFGTGQIIGVAANIIQINGLGALAAQYLAAQAGQQASILQSYSNLRLIYTSCYETSSIFWGFGLLLLGLAAWSSDLFPRWLAGFIGITGVIGLLNFIVMFVTGQYQPPVIPEILLMIVFFVSSVVFWRRKS